MYVRVKIRIKIDPECMILFKFSIFYALKFLPKEEKKIQFGRRFLNFIIDKEVGQYFSDKIYAFIPLLPLLLMLKKLITSNARRQTVRITDLDKLNLVKIRDSGKALDSRGQFHQVVYSQLLRPQIPKAPKAA